MDARWQNSRLLEMLAERSDRDKSRRPYLVFVVPRADMKSPLIDLLNSKRNFDIAARFYAAPGASAALADGAEYVMTGGLSKFHAAALFFEACGLQEAYDGYLFLDGDLEFDARELCRFLDFVHAAGLDLAQPSVTRDSYCYWKMAYHQPGYVYRDTSFVEVMAPYLSKRALQLSLPTFTQSISTYGLDLVWPSLIGTGAIGVVDAFQIRHRETVDHEGGSFYRYLKSIDVDLDEEERLILERYGVEPHQAHSLRGYVLRRPWMTTQQPVLASVPLHAIEARTDRQWIIDAVIQLARLGPRRIEFAQTEKLKPFLLPAGMGSSSS